MGSLPVDCRVEERDDSLFPFLRACGQTADVIGPRDSPHRDVAAGGRLDVSGRTGLFGHVAGSRSSGWAWATRPRPWTPQDEPRSDPRTPTLHRKGSHTIRTVQSWFPVDPDRRRDTRPRQVSCRPWSSSAIPGRRMSLSRGSRTATSCCRLLQHRWTLPLCILRSNTIARRSLAYPESGTTRSPVAAFKEELMKR